jgi:uncharacterized membrane protein
MAGIGFELKNLFADTKGVSKANIAVKSVVVSTGPWLISIATLASLLIFLKPGMSGTDFYTLSGTFVYTFIFSMIISSPISNAATRHFSKRPFQQERRKRGFRFRFRQAPIAFRACKTAGFAKRRKWS